MKEYFLQYTRKWVKPPQGTPAVEQNEVPLVATNDSAAQEAGRERLAEIRHAYKMTAMIEDPVVISRQPLQVIALPVSAAA